MMNQLHVEEYGENGPVVVLLHGIAASGAVWKALGSQLATAGYHAFALDLPGHGSSLRPVPRESYEAEAIYADFAGWIAALNLERPPYLIGHSLGGYFSLLFGLRCSQELPGLVLIDPFYSPSQLSPLVRSFSRYSGAAERAWRWVPGWLVALFLNLDPTGNWHFPPETRQRIAEDFKRTSPKAIYIGLSVRDLTADLAQMYAPTLVVWGEKDLTLSPDSFKRLAAGLPRAEGLLVGKCGHQPHQEQPHFVNARIIHFLNGLPGSG